MREAIENSPTCILGDRLVEPISEKDEFTSDVEPETHNAHHAGAIGHVVVGLSTGPTRRSTMGPEPPDGCRDTRSGSDRRGAPVFHSQGFMRRLHQSRQRNAIIARGDLSGSIADTQEDEIGLLAHSFEKMRAFPA